MGPGQKYMYRRGDPDRIPTLHSKRLEVLDEQVHEQPSQSVFHCDRNNPSGMTVAREKTEASYTSIWGPFHKDVEQFDGTWTHLIATRSAFGKLFLSCT